jgi:alkanesulfonate monooxygenase SsuD/methylene tetrahydromethanopterin reductase-like flavin-dependent oxidoreductase (luciferase family)
MRYGVFDQIEITGQPLGELYKQRLELISALDDAGFAYYFKSEHHMIPLDSIPQIGLLFAAAAQCTQRIRLGSLVYLLPFHHPLRLAEEICSLDHMLDGRFDVGVGRGISLPEHELWGLDTNRMVENFEETLAVLRAALTSDVLTFEGDTYSLSDVPILLHPLQQPMPPMWHPGNFQAAAKDGMNTIVVGPPPVIAEQAAKYHAACEAAGWSGGTVGGINTVIVAPTDAEAVAIAKRAWPVFTDHLTPLFRRWGIPPPNDPTLGGNVELALQVGAVIAGSPSTVAERLAEFEEGAGTDLFVGKFTLGDLGHAELMRSIDLFATHVMKR